MQLFIPALKLHNSAYDAAMTGEVFYKLSLICMKEAKLQDLPLDQLVSFVSPLCSNRIPLPLIDSSFCNLVSRILILCDSKILLIFYYYCNNSRLE